MPNRIISDRICRSEDYNALTPHERDLFIRLLVCADDYGRFDGRTSVIKGIAYPLIAITEKQIGEGLTNLSKAGIIDLYVVEGKSYLCFTNWDRYQQVRAKKSKYPAPENVDNTVDNVTCMQMISIDCKCPRNPIQSGLENTNCNKCAIGARAYELDRMLRSVAGYEAADWQKVVRIARQMQNVEMPLIRKAVLLSISAKDPMAYLAKLSEDWLVRDIRTFEQFRLKKDAYA